jgi:hypothetical protein
VADVGAPRAESDRVVGPAWLVPDVGAAAPGLFDVLPDGTRRLLVAGMRVLDHPDGTLERARQVLPNAPTRWVELPARFGGGLLLYASAGTTTDLWRTKTWLDRLDPLTEVWGQVVDIVPGFDRLYARLDTGDFRAIDPQSGKPLPLDPLPRATRVGLLSFADAWRAVAVTDFRGALATFDAGASWRPVPLGGRNVLDLWLRDGTFILENQRDRWLLGPGGDLSKDEASLDPPRIVPAAGAAARAPATSRLREVMTLPEAYGSGRRPLRAAIEDGWPVGWAAVDTRRDGPPAFGRRPGPGDTWGTSAVVAQAGALYRVDLSNGAVLDWNGEAFRAEDVACHAVSIGAGFGFVCAGQAGGTALYRFEPPFAVREIARFAGARVVVPSGNGGFVVLGSCDRRAKRIDPNVFCFSWSSGAEREVRAPAAVGRRGDARPVALRDGRAAFLVSPGEMGGAAVGAAAFGARLVIIDPNDAQSSVPLGGADAFLRRASLLEGVEEREPGVLAAWVLVGAELHGVRVHLDGKVEVGRTGADVERTSIAGRYALNWGTVGRGAETVDGGMTWTMVDLPSSELPAPGRPVAACGPVGCVQKGWARVGWGSGRAPDLASAPAPKPSRIALTPARGISLRCELTGDVTGPGVPAVTRSNDGWARNFGASSGGSALSPLTLLPLPGAMRASPMILPLAKPTPVASAPSGLPLSGWTSFRGSPPPVLSAGEVGLEAGTDPPVTMQARVYAWGPRAPGWPRAAQVQAKFDDRFDLNGTRATRATTSFWADEERAADALGLLPAHTVNWAALLDPSGQAAVLFAQQGAGRADVYGAAQGEPLTEWHNAEGGALPVPTSVVRVGPSWFFLASSMAASAWQLSVFRVDGGVARRLIRLPRVPAPAGEAGPKLVRRSGGEGLGLLVQGAPGFEQTIRDWYVLPLDPTSGELGEPLRLVGSDLEGQVPPRCAGDADVWWVNTELALSPAVQVIGPPLASLSAIEMRLGLGPGTACVESIAARGERLSGAAPILAKVAPYGARPPIDATRTPGAWLPMVATDPSSGRRWLLRCRPP